MATWRPRRTQRSIRRRRSSASWSVVNRWGPVGECLGSEPQALHVGKVIIEQRFDVSGQGARSHHHGVAPGDEHVGHLGMNAEVGAEKRSIADHLLQSGITHELRPAKAVATVGVAGLSLRRKEEHGLAVLVLHALQSLAVEKRDVPVELPGGVRIQFAAKSIGDGPDLGGAAIAIHQTGDGPESVPWEHVSMGKRQTVDRIVGNVGPVDQFVHHVVVDLEGQHLRDHADVPPDLRGKALHRLEVGELRGGVRCHSRSQLPLNHGISSNRVLSAARPAGDVVASRRPGGVRVRRDGRLRGQSRGVVESRRAIKGRASA